MKIDAIHLDHFRNYERLDLELSAGTNLFFGDNAQGKTNILEAVYLCGTSRSHRTGKDQELIRFGAEEAHLRMEMRKNEVPYRIDLHLKKGRSKGIAINASPIRRAGDLIGLGNYVIFSPEDLQIIKSGPGERRKFMDMELCQLEKVYVHELNQYKKALAQRNALLKDLSFHPDLRDTLDIWDDQMAGCGERVITSRERFIERINEQIAGVHGRLTGEKEQIRVVYLKSCEASDYRRELMRCRERDIHLKTTTVGPHRDDLQITANGVDVRRFGSQGQQRTAALSLKLAEIELVKQVSRDTPVLLLDDVLSELDQSRQRFLLGSIRDIQTLITCTGISDFKDNQFPIDSLFHVHQGTVEQIK